VGSDVKELLASILELLRDQQQEIHGLQGSVRALYEFARERDPSSALDLGQKSSEYKKHEASGYNAEKLRQLDVLLRELKK